MPSEKPVFEGAGVPFRRLTTAAGLGFGVLLLALLGMFGLYTLWVNGPQAPVSPAPLANAAAPSLETTLFRERVVAPPVDPKAAAAQGYRWRDGAHARVEIPVDRAMAMTAARGAQAFDPVDGAVAAPGDGR